MSPFLIRALSGPFVDYVYYAPHHHPGAVPKDLAGQNAGPGCEAAEREGVDVAKLPAPKASPNKPSSRKNSCAGSKKFYQSERKQLRPPEAAVAYNCRVYRVLLVAGGLF